MLTAGAIADLDLTLLYFLLLCYPFVLFFPSQPLTEHGFSIEILLGALAESIREASEKTAAAAIVEHSSRRRTEADAFNRHRHLDFYILPFFSSSSNGSFSCPAFIDSLHLKSNATRLHWRLDPSRHFTAPSSLYISPAVWFWRRLLAEHQQSSWRA